MMTIRQQFLKIVYPLYVRLAKVSKSKTRILLNKDVLPPVSFYSLLGEMCDDKRLDFSTLKNKKVLLVNTASGCGFTEQYDQLQQLFRQFSDDLVIIAFPTNDFDEEKKDDEEIALFCKENFRVSFPIMKKSVVQGNRHQNNIFQWLSDPTENGWNSQSPTWNFCKYLVNEQGMLVGFFGSAVEPVGKEIMNALNHKKPVSQL